MIQNAHLRTIIEEEQAKAKRDKGNTSEFDIALAKSSAVNTLNYHKKPINDLYKELGTDPVTGITNSQASEKLKIFGPNKLKEAKQHSWFVRLLLEMVGLFACILWVGAILSFISYGLDQSDPSSVFC